MKVVIQSRVESERISKYQIFQNVAVISITDFGWEFADFKRKPKFCLQLMFDDVDNDVIADCESAVTKAREHWMLEERYHMFNDKQAQQVAQFYSQVREKAEILICQCEHGQSRSAAIAAAILEFQNGTGIDIFANDKYYPNKVVFRKTLEGLRRECL